MLCDLLIRAYGCDTRSTQVLNILFSGMWVLGLGLHRLGLLQVDIPVIVNNNIDGVTIIALLAMGFSILGFVTKERRHQVFKFFGISIGAVLQGVLANGYFTAFPPLEVILVINLTVLFWFVGALLYIAKCEGFDGKYGRKP